MHAAPSAITWTFTRVFHTAQPRYVLDKSREPCCAIGFVGYPRRARALATRSETASPPSELRLKIHGPLGNGCSATISLRSTASLSVPGLTPTNAAASVNVIQPSAARRSLE